MSCSNAKIWANHNSDIFEIHDIMITMSCHVWSCQTLGRFFNATPSTIFCNVLLGQSLAATSHFRHYNHPLSTVVLDTISMTVLAIISRTAVVEIVHRFTHRIAPHIYMLCLISSQTKQKTEKCNAIHFSEHRATANEVIKLSQLNSKCDKQRQRLQLRLLLLLHRFYGFCSSSRTTWLNSYQKSRMVKPVSNYLRHEMTRFWHVVAVASAGPYANNLHLAPDR